MLPDQPFGEDGVSGDAMDDSFESDADQGPVETNDDVGDMGDMMQRSASLPDLLDAQISSEPLELTAPLPPPRRAGCLVLSEFSTASHVINGSIKVNPFNIPEVTNAFDTAVLMPANERATRQWRDF